MGKAKRKAKAKTPKVTAPVKRVRAAAAKPKPGVKPKPQPLKSFKSFTELAHAVHPKGETPKPAQPTRKLSDVKVGKRFRQDKGDIAGLAASIDARGALLQAITIDPAGKLIDGERRMLAWNKSRFAGQPIPVRVVDIDSLIAGEWDANAHRKDFTYSEAVAIKRAIEGKLADMARSRHGKAGEGQGRAGDQAAMYVGKKRRSLEKAEAIVEAAEQDPERFGRLKEDMDRSGRVDAPFKRLKNIKSTEALKAEPPPLPMRGPYRTLLIDFPWASEEEGDAPGRGYYPYPTMGLNEICAYARDEIKPIMHPDGCAVWLLIPNFHMVRGWHVRVLAALGLTASTKLTWCKPELGRGRRLRGANEDAILGIAGDVPIAEVAQGTWFTASAPREQHSDKPAELIAIIEKVTPAPRYAYLFAGRELPENWDGHGDRVGVSTPVAADRHPDAPPAAPALPTLAAGNHSAPEDELACLEAIETGAALPPATAIDHLRSAGYVKGKKAPKLTKFGAKRLTLLRELARGKRAAAEDAWGGHIVSMTIDWTPGKDNANLKQGLVGISVGTCKCGAEFRVPRGETPEDNVAAGHEMEALIVAHRREVGADRHAQPTPSPDPHPEEAAPSAAVSKDEAGAAPEQGGLPGFLRRGADNEVPA